MDLKRLGELLRKHRTHRGYSLRKAASEIGISSTALSHAELGKDICQLSGDTLCRLGNLYGTDEMVYLRLAERMPSHVFDVLVRYPAQASELASELLRDEEYDA